MIGYDQVEYGSVTDVGMVRSHNQDYHTALLATDAEQFEHEGHIFLVADGMGGHAVGELASELAAGIIPHTYHKHAVEGPEPALRQAFMEANASINARGQQNVDFKGMGTTATALLLRPSEAWIAHVGDSRAYRVRNGWIEQLSFDHSLVWEMARRQKKDPEELTDVRSNVITRSLGPEPLVQVDVEGPFPLDPGDTFVLCSDGLSGQVTDAEIGAVAGALPPAEACRFLVNLANLHGGPDNITVVIVHARGGSETAPAPAAAPSQSTARWWRRIPWPLLMLIFGVLYAGEAAFLAVLKLPWGRYYFGLGAAGLVTGLLGLGFYYLQERRASNGRGSKTPRIYRRTACSISPLVVERMIDTGKELKHLLEERNWEVDWKDYEKHRLQADEHQGRGELDFAFRESCRAVRPFTEALQRHRSREESFQPVWDRDRKKR